MNANELRINNAVYCKYRHGHFLVKEITETDVRIAEPERGYKYWQSYEQIIPIPLSPDILQAAGFEQLHPKSWNLSWESYELQYSEHDKELGILSPDGCTSGHTVYFPCGQLHLLQNIYFFFTGTELTINLEKVKV